MKTTTKLAFGSIRANRTRSVLTGIAICLTTMLVTAITFGGNAAIREEKENAAELYGEYYGMFGHVTPAQQEAVRLHGQFSVLGTLTYAASVELKGYSMNLQAMDSTMAVLAHLAPESGTMPGAEDEIVAQREFFQAAGDEDPQISDVVMLPVRINGEGEIIEKGFVISGFLPSNQASDLAKRYIGYVSAAFVEANIPEADRDVWLGFQVENEENLGSTAMKEKIHSLAEELGIPKSGVSVNEGYLGWTLDPDMEKILACACIVLVILFVSVFVIYNIFNVAVVQKIREYGRLKTLGADRRQLRRIIWLEGTLLSCASVPAGLALGTLVLKIFFLWMAWEGVQVFSLPLAAFVAALILCTVRISMQKPMRIASHVSPVEAVRFAAEGGRGRRKIKTNINVMRLTFSNLALHRGRTATTILAMGLSCLLFVVIANVVGNMDADAQTRVDLEYGRFRIELDYSLNDKTYPENNLEQLQKAELLNEEFINQIREIDGVTEIWTRKLLKVCAADGQSGEADEQGRGADGQGRETDSSNREADGPIGEPSGPSEEAGGQDEEASYCAIAVVDEEGFQWLLGQAERGVVDYANTAEQDGVIYMWDYFMDEEYQIGDTYRCEIFDGDRRIPFSGPILGSCGYSNDADLTMTESTFEKLGFREDATGILFVDCEPEAEAAVRQELERLVESRDHLAMTCFSDALRLTEFSISFMKNASYAFLAILGLIGFMNMANTMITNILTRRREFGVLQALGMSSRHLNQMLQAEGLFFTAGTLAIALILGNAVGHYAFLRCREAGYIGLFEYHFPLPEIAVLVISVAALQAALAFVLSRSLKRDSLAERIREE